MPRFLTGDELGSIKSVRYSPNVAHGDPKATTTTLYSGASNPVHVLAISEQSSLVAVGFADGSVTVFGLGEADTLSDTHRWKETRLRDGHRYIGLAISAKRILSCTSNGALRLVPLGDEEKPKPNLSCLPTRLGDWRLSPDQQTFAFGGDEVDLSVWDTERAFSTHPQNAVIENEPPKKRKRTELFAGELWRARNVPNDNLGLRQPVHITALTYLGPNRPQQLIAGTQLGNVRHYDTRTARRPIFDWKLARVGGIQTLEKGTSEHEAFASDNGNNICAFDLRNGGIIHSYKGFSGAVTSIAPSPCGLASTARDRYTRIHSAYPPPTVVGQQQERKGEVLEKIFMTSTPTVVVWDRDTSVVEKKMMPAHEEDNVWDTMENADDIY